MKEENIFFDSTFSSMNPERLFEFQTWHISTGTHLSLFAGVLEKADAFETGSSRCKRRLLVPILRILLQAQFYFRIYPEREIVTL